MNNNEYIKTISNYKNDLLTDLNHSLDEELKQPFELWNDKKILILLTAIGDIQELRLSEEEIAKRKNKILDKLEVFSAETEVIEVDRKGIMRNNNREIL